MTTKKMARFVRKHPVWTTTLALIALIAVAAYLVFSPLPDTKGTVADEPSLSTTNGGTVQVPPPADDYLPSDAVSFGLTADDVFNARATLAGLRAAGKGPMTEYSGNREKLFGPAWTDKAKGVAMAGNKCDTRNDILKRDLTQVKLDKDGCTVLSGKLWDPYNAQWIDFQRGKATSSKVQIDHIIPLGNAWATGAPKLTQEQRVALANDPRNLIAVDGPTNGQKSDKDASGWRPKNRAVWCYYAASQIRVKSLYSLYVTAAEKNALEEMLDTCPKK